MLVVSDTSPINALQRIGHLHLLPAIFGRVVIPPSVRLELQNAKNYGLDLDAIVNADFILIDERQGRIIATQQGIQVIGVFGILLRAKEAGLVYDIAPLLDLLVQKVGFWIAESTRQKMLKLAGEG